MAGRRGAWWLAVKLAGDSVARIRTIKPEFFTSEDIVSLSPLARLLYIALWCEADREGRLEWKPRTFKIRYLPADSCDIEALCKELTDSKLVVLYGDGLCAYVPRFLRHQHINPRETASTLPDPHASPTRQPRVKHASPRDSDAHGGRERKGKERNTGDKSPVAPSDESNDAHGPKILIPLADGSEHGVMAEEVAGYAETFPGVDVMQQLRNMRAWLQASPERRKTPRGVRRFIAAWLTRAQDRGKPMPTAAFERPATVPSFEAERTAQMLAEQRMTPEQREAANEARRRVMSAVRVAQ